jgi:adenylate cyclase
MPIMTDPAQPGKRAGTDPDSVRVPSARKVYRDLIRLELEALLAAISVLFMLTLLGLNLTAAQWGFMLLATPFSVTAFTVPDIYLIKRHFRPIGVALSRLDHGETPTRTEASAAVTRSLNLPLFSVLRNIVIHGPVGSAFILIAFEILNEFGAGFALWQKLIFVGTVFLFATPTHAMIEFFRITHYMAPTIIRLAPFCQDGILPEHQSRLISVRLRSKLLYLSIGIAGMPLVFFGISTGFKIHQLLWISNAGLNLEQMLPLWRWIAGVVAACLILTLAMIMFTASEASRLAASLSGAMRRVEAGNLDVDLHVTSTDEHAELFRGFNHMIRGLREEVQLLEVTRSLAGELNLDILIQRIMSAASDLLDAERASLFVYDRKTDQLWSRYAAGLHSGEIRIPSHAGIAGTVFTTGKTENIPDVYADPRFDQSVDRATGYRTRSILAMPIVNNAGARIGVTEVLNKKGSAAFSVRDEARLGAFAAQVAGLLENAKLFDEVLSVKNYNENILRSTSNGMITLDSEDRVVTANEAALAILKMPAENLVGTPAGELFSGENAWVMTSMARMEQTGQREIAIDARLAFGGGAVSVNLTAQPLFGPDGAPIGSMLVFEDFTAETRVRAMMARYMSAEVVEQVLAGGESELGGKTQTVSILFSDVRNFTGVSEALGARETVSLLNEYFGEMVEVVTRHGGILDKYIGDAIMALFGAPFAKSEDADHALAVGNGMLVSLRELNGRREADGKQPIDIGVGIATGEVVLGNIGSPSRMEYTVIGDKVNLASRLEGANKYYHSKILLDETTVNALTNGSADCLREIDLLRVKGKDRPVAVYESLGYLEPGPLLEEAMDCFGAGLAAYRGSDWERAIQRFAAALELRPDDEPSRMYIERCRHYREAPPPADWGGVWTLTEK